MKARALKLVKWIAALSAASLLTLFAVRAWDAHRADPLELWHTFVPHELTAKEIDRSDWQQYLVAEQRLFDDVRANVTDRLPEAARDDANRYYAGAPIYPGRFATDWNRSYVMQPARAPTGAVVLLHGLTDTPYSLRHVARRYADDGFVAVAIRLPGHGTVPGGLSDVQWEQWSAATRLAVREARRLANNQGRLHIVGFSNGGALAMKYALDALGDPGLARPDRIVLLSPMIGITSLARFAGVFGWPAMFPAFANAAWLGIVPEFNPFKYNSFPVNGARQSSLVARTLQAQINDAARAGRLKDLAPVLTFQSVVDFTVSTRAIITALYANLPPQGSELVLFDLNRNAQFGPLLRSSTDTIFARLLPSPPRNYRMTIITNAGPGQQEVVERVTEAGQTTEQTRPLTLVYPRDVFSLSHVAIPFPMNDPLYGLTPDHPGQYGVNLGSLATRGERGTLIVSLDALVRMSANPFYPYMMERIEEGLGIGRRETPANVQQ